MNRTSQRRTSRERSALRSSALPRRGRDSRRLVVENLENRNMLSALDGADFATEQGGFVTLDAFRYSIADHTIVVQSAASRSASLRIDGHADGGSRSEGGAVDLNEPGSSLDGSPQNSSETVALPAVSDKLRMPAPPIVVFVPVDENQADEEGGFVVIPPPGRSTAPIQRNFAPSIAGKDSAGADENGSLLEQESASNQAGLTVDGLDQSKSFEDAELPISPVLLQGGVGRSQAFVLASSDDDSADAAERRHSADRQHPRSQHRFVSRIDEAQEGAPPALLATIAAEQHSEADEAKRAADPLQQAGGKTWRVERSEGESAALHDAALAEMFASTIRSAAEFLDSGVRQHGTQLILLSLTGGMLADIARRQSRRSEADASAR